MSTSITKTGILQTTGTILNPNLFANSDFHSRYSQTTGWDTTKNGTTLASSWGGYNSGVANASTVYHAHLVEFNGEWVYDYHKTANETQLGMSQGGFQSILISGQEYTMSWEQYGLDGGNYVGTGLYYYKPGATSANFHLGLKYGNTEKENGKWQKFSFTFTAPSDGDYTKNMSWYIYGHYGSNGEFYIRHPKLEIGDTSTAFTLSTVEGYQALSHGFVENPYANAHIDKANYVEANSFYEY